MTPVAVRSRLAPYVAPDLKLTPGAWASVVISIALGVVTHIVWDEFTHAAHFGPALLPLLSEPWLGSQIPGYGQSLLASSGWPR